jgi:hypothetical protein
MGGDSESSNSTTNNTTNTSGSAAVNGDNYGPQISGVSGSDINVEMSDHGAIDGALDLAGDVVDTMGDALGSMENVTDSALDAMSDAVTSGNNLASNVVDKNNDFLENVLENNSNLVDNVLDSNNDIYEGALDSVNSASGQIASSNKDSLAFAEKMAKEAMTDNDITTQKQMMYVVGGLIAAIGIVFTVKAWKS